MTAHNPEGGPHAPDAFRITKISYNKLLAEHGEDHEMVREAKAADQLLELASCPSCQLSVPIMATVMVQLPDVAAGVILHLAAALARANAMIIKGSDNFMALDDEVRDELRVKAGAPKVPDFVPDA